MVISIILLLLMEILFGSLIQNASLIQKNTDITYLDMVTTSFTVVVVTNFVFTIRQLVPVSTNNN